MKAIEDMQPIRKKCTLELNLQPLRRDPAQGPFGQDGGMP
jgi:hypothetical protein